METTSLKVLIAPLDWGLGHASRCIPLINKLLSMNVSVTIAASGPSAFLLQEAFPGLKILYLEGYQIRYQGRKGWFTWKLLQQIPRIKSTIKQEKKWLSNFLQKENFDAIISDNRYGFYDTSIPSIIITHQLCIQTGWSFSNYLLQKFHYRLINKFTSCWVPDLPKEPSLAGKLSHPVQMPGIPVSYLGPLTRFSKKENFSKYRLCILLSGPEPQRTIFEEQLIEQLKRVSFSVMLIRGLPGSDTLLNGLPENIIQFNHLRSEDLQKIVAGSEYVLARSGYSSIMDLLSMGSKCIFVPTPGQTEQQYLARHLANAGYAFSCLQKNFSLETALTQATAFKYGKPPKMVMNEMMIEEWVKGLPLALQPASR
ncbi:MAG: glycosyltransferase [Sphingobacteriales bacterium]|nr:glycosyltransferase [Sphingobacteriales bacterium]